MSMPSQILLNDYLGKLVWYFERNDAGILKDDPPKTGIIIDINSDGTVLVLDGLRKCKVSSMDFEVLEDWDENLERKNGQMEETRAGSREHDRNSPK